MSKEITINNGIEAFVRENLETIMKCNTCEKEKSTKDVFIAAGAELLFCEHCGGIMIPDRDNAGSLTFRFVLESALVSRKKEEPKKVFLYLATFRDMVKIGVSTVPEERKKQFTFKVSDFKVFEVEDAFKLEREMHLKFKDNQISKELFNIDILQDAISYAEQKSIK